MLQRQCQLLWQPPGWAGAESDDPVFTTTGSNQITVHHQQVVYNICIYTYTYTYTYIYIYVYIYIYISISSYQYIQFRYFMQTSFEIGGFTFFRWYPMIAYFVPAIRWVGDFVVRVVPIFNDRFGPCFLRPSAIPRKCTSCFLNLNSHALIGSILKEVTVPISYVWVTCMQSFL